jgi:hypothetical protein
MRQLFLESLALGAFLTFVLAAGHRLVRRVLARRIGALPQGQELRCVRPLDLRGN